MTIMTSAGPVMALNRSTIIRVTRSLVSASSTSVSPGFAAAEKQLRTDP